MDRQVATWTPALVFWYVVSFKPTCLQLDAALTL
jgi:hypothetical protein